MSKTERTDSVMEWNGKGHGAKVGNGGGWNGAGGVAAGRECETYLIKRS